MKYKKITKSLLAVGVLSASAMVQAQTLEVHAAYGKNTPVLWDSVMEFSKTVENQSNGDVKIKAFGSGELVSTAEIFDAVSTGSIDAGWGFLVYWGNKVPAGNIAGMPFGPSPTTMASWALNGGGEQILQKAYAEHNIKLLACHITQPEPAGWFNKEINTAEDLSGLKMRISGLGGKVLNELGATAQYLPAGELYLSMERGRIDATEFSLPQIDKSFGFNKVAKYYYYPGWHQTTSLDALLVNMDVWSKLDASQQKSIQTSCKLNLLDTLTNSAKNQTPIIEEFEADGVEVRRLPDAVLAVLRATSKKVIAKEVAADAYYGEAYESLTNYINSAGRWESLQYISN